MSEIKLNKPHGLYVSNREVFIADLHNHRVRKLLQNGQAVTIAGTGEQGYNGDGQLATDAQLSGPIAVFVSSNDEVYISDYLGHRIRKILRDGTITTIAGTGVSGYSGDGGLAVNAQIDSCTGLFVTDDGEVYLCDFGNQRIRKIDRSGIISTVAGTGAHGYNGDGISATQAQLNNPMDLYVYKNEVYISDYSNSRIRKMDQDGIITTVAGTGVSGYNGDDQLATLANLYYPHSLVVEDDCITFNDSENQRVRRVLADGTIQTIAGTGQKSASTSNLTDVNTPTGLSIEKSQIYISDSLSRVCKIGPNGKIETIAGSGVKGYSGDVPFDFNTNPHRGRGSKN